MTLGSGADSLFYSPFVLGVTSLTYIAFRAGAVLSFSPSTSGAVKGTASRPFGFGLPAFLQRVHFFSAVFSGRGFNILFILATRYRQGHTNTPTSCKRRHSKCPS